MSLTQWYSIMISQKIFFFCVYHPHQLTNIPFTGEYLATLPGSLKKFPSKFVTLPPYNGAHEPSLKPFKSQTPFRGAPRIHSRSDAFVPRFLSRYVNAHTCVRECRSLFYRFFPDSTPPLVLQRRFQVARSDHRGPPFFGWICTLYKVSSTFNKNEIS